MSSKKGRKVSRKTAKKYFSSIGVFLILYALGVLVLPYFLLAYLNMSGSIIVSDPILYFGVYFLIILFGTMIPFFMMRKFVKMPLKKFNRNTDISFVDIFVQTTVFFTVCLILTYVSNVIFSYLGLGDKLISAIGFSFDEAYLDNALYVFMLIVVTPFIEEYAFRGVLLNALGKYGKLFGLIASSLLFALAHVNFAEMIPAFAMGYFLGGTSLRYKSVQPAIVIHILFNLFIYALCVLPSNVAQYMSYGLVAIFLLAIFFVISGKYQRVKIQTLKSSRVTNFLFYSRWSILIAILLMIVSTLLRTYLVL